MIVYLTQEEYEFLLNENFLSEYLIDALKNIDVNYNLNINEDDADSIRDECGEHLQIVGFDKNDNPKPKGIILEKLIDKFFTG
jgi:hypothetical protein